MSADWAPSGLLVACAIRHTVLVLRLPEWRAMDWKAYVLIWKGGVDSL